MEARRELKDRPNRLLELRKRSRLTQTEVGRLLGDGVTPSVVSRAEKGRKGLAHETVVSYAKIYKVDTFELFIDPENIPATANRLSELRAGSRLLPSEVARVSGIEEERVKALEAGAALTVEEVHTLARLYKVWTYELYFDRWGGYDAWDHVKMEYTIHHNSVA